jgi:Domain of unknown function (DUF4232)
VPGRQLTLKMTVAIAAACVSAIVFATPATSLGATPLCTASSLSLEFSRDEAATSHRFWDLALRNVGSFSCHLRGYPGVGLLDAHANVMNVSVSRVSSPLRTVVLKPWDRAFFTFSFVVSGPCAHGIFPFGIQVIPPSGTVGLRRFRRFDVCGGSHPGVTAVRATL